MRTHACRSGNQKLSKCSALFNVLWKKLQYLKIFYYLSPLICQVYHHNLSLIQFLREWEVLRRYSYSQGQSLKFVMWPKMIQLSWFFCLHLASTRIRGFNYADTQHLPDFCFLLTHIQNWFGTNLTIISLWVSYINFPQSF